MSGHASNALRCRRLVSLLAIVLALCAGCEATGFTERPQPSNPDEVLARCLDQLGRTRAGDGEDVQGDVRSGLDAHYFVGEVRRLALEFPNHVPTLFANALLSREAGEREDAQRYLDRVLALDPTHVEALVLRSHIALQEGDVMSARELLTHGLLLAPDQAELHEALAAVQYVAGEFDQARASLVRAEKLGAPNWRTAYDRGLVEEAVGEPAHALEQYEITLRARPDFEPARARSRALHANDAASPR